MDSEEDLTVRTLITNLIHLPEHDTPEFKTPNVKKVLKTKSSRVSTKTDVPTGRRLRERSTAVTTNRSSISEESLTPRRLVRALIRDLKDVPDTEPREPRENKTSNLSAASKAKRKKRQSIPSLNIQADDSDKSDEELQSFEDESARPIIFSAKRRRKPIPVEGLAQEVDQLLKHRNLKTPKQLDHEGVSTRKAFAARSKRKIKLTDFSKNIDDLRKAKQAARAELSVEKISTSVNNSQETPNATKPTDNRTVNASPKSSRLASKAAGSNVSPSKQTGQSPVQKFYSSFAPRKSTGSPQNVSLSLKEYPEIANTSLQEALSPVAVILNKLKTLDLAPSVSLEKTEITGSREKSVGRPRKSTTTTEKLLISAPLESSGMSDSFVEPSKKPVGKNIESAKTTKKSITKSNLTAITVDKPAETPEQSSSNLHRTRELSRRSSGTPKKSLKASDRSVHEIAGTPNKSSGISDGVAQPTKKPIGKPKKSTATPEKSVLAPLKSSELSNSFYESPKNLETTVTGLETPDAPVHTPNKPVRRRPKNIAPLEKSVPAPLTSSNNSNNFVETPKSLETTHSYLENPDNLVEIPNKSVGSPEKTIATVEGTVGKALKSFETPVKLFRTRKSSRTPGKLIEAVEASVESTLKSSGKPETLIEMPNKGVTTLKKSVGQLKKPIPTPELSIGAVKKSVGRPKKSILTKNSVTSPKRSVGRPKKNVVSLEMSPGESNKKIATLTKSEMTHNKPVATTEKPVANLQKSIEIPDKTTVPEKFLTPIGIPGKSAASSEKSSAVLSTVGTPEKKIRSPKKTDRTLESSSKHKAKASKSVVVESTPLKSSLKSPQVQYPRKEVSFGATSFSKNLSALSTNINDLELPDSFVTPQTESSKGLVNSRSGLNIRGIDSPAEERQETSIRENQAENEVLPTKERQTQSFSRQSDVQFEPPSPDFNENKELRSAINSAIERSYKSPTPEKGRVGLTRPPSTHREATAEEVSSDAEADDELEDESEKEDPGDEFDDDFKDIDDELDAVSDDADQPGMVENKPESDIPLETKATKVRTKTKVNTNPLQKFAMNRFNFHSKMPVDKSCTSAIVQGVETFLDNLLDQLKYFAEHDHRKKITEKDIRLFLWRQGYTTKKRSYEYLVMKYMPRELQQKMLHLPKVNQPK